MLAFIECLALLSVVSSVVGSVFPLAGTMASWARCAPYVVGQIAALGREGYSQRDVAARVFKEDGTSPSQGSVAANLQRLKNPPEWSGDRKRGSGAKRKTTPTQDKAQGSQTKSVFRFRAQRFDFLVHQRTLRALEDRADPALQAEGHSVLGPSTATCFPYAQWAKQVS